jgi:hypothetical protein
LVPIRSYIVEIELNHRPKTVDDIGLIVICKKPIGVSDQGG